MCLCLQRVRVSVVSPVYSHPPLPPSALSVSISSHFPSSPSVSFCMLSFSLFPLLLLLLLLPSSLPLRRGHKSLFRSDSLSCSSWREREHLSGQFKANGCIGLAVAHLPVCVVPLRVEVCLCLCLCRSLSRRGDTTAVCVLRHSPFIFANRFDTMDSVVSCVKGCCVFNSIYPSPPISRSVSLLLCRCLVVVQRSLSRLLRSPCGFAILDYNAVHSTIECISVIYCE